MEAAVVEFVHMHLYITVHKISIIVYGDVYMRVYIDTGSEILVVLFE